MFLPLVVLVLLEMSLLCRATSSADSDNFKRMYNFGLGKRAAYSYVSEYKRLPVYNFGLGKRANDAKGKFYSFGLGKRDYDSDEQFDDDEEGKRIRPYPFDMGKRLAPKSYSFGLGKRGDGKMYAFGLGKRLPWSDYNIEDYDFIDENKRAADSNGHRFSFGLGKRDSDDFNNSLHKV